MQALFLDKLPADTVLFGEFHALIVRLGKEFCKKTKPLCENCPLFQLLTPLRTLFSVSNAMTSLFSNFEQTLTTSPLLALVLAYVGGLLASLTPCVYPMLPVVAGVIGHANVGGTRMRAFWLSCLHVLGMALTYTTLGFFAATTGRLFGAAASSPWMLLIVGNLMLLFALWMLDLIQTPVLTGPTLSRLTDKGGLLGIFFTGIASALVAGPCTTPVLGALLTYAASTGSTVFGALLFFMFSLGLGTLLLLVGSFSGVLTALPRSGEWMVRIKKGLGLLILATAEYFIFRAGMQAL